MSRIILHVDMDCFFAAIEIRENPELKGKPVVIGADPKEGKGRGVVSTCSMEARKFGVHSATPISRAYRLCPQAIFIKPNFSLYRQVSKSVMKILRPYTDQFQQMGIDEAFLDITGKVVNFEEARKVALEIKQKVKEKEGITCSIGMGPNKLIAKIGSDYQKPDGLTVVKDHLKEFLEPMPIRKLYGVGAKMEQKLKKMGIHTIGNLAVYNKEALIKRFGVYGLYLHSKAHGLGSETVREGEGRSSISKEMTFYEDTDNFNHIHEAIQKMAKIITQRLKREGYHYKTVSIKIRMENFTTYTRSRTVNYCATDTSTLTKNAIDMCQEFIGNKIRLIGVRASHLGTTQGQKMLTSFS